jgi:hypothetical protein
MRSNLPEPLHAAIKLIFDQVSVLRQRYPGKRFTPGDMLIGDTGEALAEILFDVIPLTGNSKSHDCRCARSNRSVQIKTTSGNRVGLGREKTEFEHLLAFKIYADGTFEVIYNGAGSRVSKHIAGNSSAGIQVAALRELNKEVSTDEALPLKFG